MGKRIFLALALSGCFGFGLHTASAQLPSGIPRIPRPGRPKPTPTPAETAQPAPATSETRPAARPTQQSAPAATTAAPAAQGGADQPTIAKDSILVRAATVNSYKGNFDVWSWVPEIKLRVNGPIPSGSQLHVEFTQPGGAAPWVQFDCPTQETQKGYWWQISDCGGRKIEDKSTTAVGPVNFSIKLRNELAGGEQTLFTGRAKVAKALSNLAGPKAAQKFVYYVDQDWNLPIGYVYYTPDSVYGWDYPVFNVAFWVRGETGNLEPHIFHKGQEVGKVFTDGIQVGKPSCDGRHEVNPTHYVNDSLPQKAKWVRVECKFPTVKRWDKTDGGQGQPNTKEMFKTASNPGEYEVKVLRDGRLARSIKFTVLPEGRLDWGITNANKLGSDRGITPVAVLGDQDGAWDRAAWKTEAFYGNPLTGFSPPQ